MTCSIRTVVCVAQELLSVLHKNCCLCCTRTVVCVAQELLSVLHKNCCPCCTVCVAQELLCSTVCVAQELLSVFHSLCCTRTVVCVPQSVLHRNCCLCSTRTVVSVAEGVEEAGQSCEGTCLKAAREVSGCRGNDRKELRRTALQCSHISSHHMTCIAWLHLHACLTML